MYKYAGYLIEVNDKIVNFSNSRSAAEKVCKENNLPLSCIFQIYRNDNKSYILEKSSGATYEPDENGLLKQTKETE